MADDLESIKSKINIVDLVQEYLPLKKAGRNFKGLCPFHNEKSPSFIVSPDRQIFHCFGCGSGGDVFGFMMKIENIDFVEALRSLAKRAGIVLSSFRPTGESEIKEKIYEINHLASEFYHYLLFNRDFSKKALTYLTERGIKKSTLELFKIGYAPAMWQSVSKFLIGKKKYSPKDLEQAGLCLRGRDLYDRFRDRIVFPLVDQRGNTVGFSGRLLDPEAKESKYVNSPETPVYIKSNHLYGINLAKDAIKKENKAILVEGEFDMLSSYQMGVKNIVAIKGSALTDGQVNLLKRYTENLLFCLDADFAGNNAAKRGIEIADNAGFNMRVIILPYGKDPDECIKKDPDLWREAIKKAIPIYDYLINLALEKYDRDSPEGKKAISVEVLPFLAKSANEIVKSHYVKKLSQLLSVSEDAVNNQMEKIGKMSFLPKGTNTTNLDTTKPKSREENLEEYLLAYLIQAENLSDIFAKIKKLIKRTDFTSLILGKIYHSLEEIVAQNETIDTKKILEALPKELLPTIDRLYLLDLSHLDKEKDADLAPIKLAVQIAELSIKREMKEIIEKIKETDEASPENELLNDKFSKLKERLKKIKE